jgi:hypothetical protein
MYMYIYTYYVYLHIHKGNIYLYLHIYACVYISLSRLISPGADAKGVCVCCVSAESRVSAHQLVRVALDGGRLRGSFAQPGRPP